VAPDHRDQHVTRTNRSLDLVDKIYAGLDSPDIPEDLTLREALREQPVEIASVPGAIFAPIADEDP